MEEVMGYAKVLMWLSFVQLIQYFLEVTDEMWWDLDGTLILLWDLSLIGLHHVLGKNKTPYCVRQLLDKFNSLGARDLDASWN